MRIKRKLPTRHLAENESNCMGDENNEATGIVATTAILNAPVPNEIENIEQTANVMDNGNGSVPGVDTQEQIGDSVIKKKKKVTKPKRKEAPIDVTFKTYLDDSKFRFDPHKKPDTLLGAVDLRGFTLDNTNKKPTLDDVKALNNSNFVESQTNYNQGLMEFKEELKIPTSIEQKEILAQETSEQKKGI